MRKRIDYGIDLGTTNSAISVMKEGKPTIIKSDVGKDTIASCVHFSTKQSINVGERALSSLTGEWELKLRKDDYSPNTFIEFKRTIGTNTNYFSSNMNRNYSSEELSAEVLRKLKTFVPDKNFDAVVITVPAKFTINQRDATVKAVKLAGFKHCELLQEPVAASFAYGLDSGNKNGVWLVFDFGGGTFDAALVRAEEGIMKVFDTEGDNHLGGKDIDHAITEEILIPYLLADYSIADYLQNGNKKKILKTLLKPLSEEAKIQISFQENSFEILSDIGRNYGKDSAGRPFEFDLTLTLQELEAVEKPFFQRAINIALDLLKRNNLKGEDLQTVILVGGPTYSPVLKRMIHEQISDKTYFDDPMTIVARGAALYASTIEIPEAIIDETRNRGKVQLEVKHEPTSIESEEFVTVKILRDKTDFEVPETVFVEMARGDENWTSPKIKVDEIGELITVKLNENKANIFQINLYDDFGNRLDCEPNEFTIIQGIVTPTAGLSYHFAIGIRDHLDERNIVATIKGLEKNTPMPAKGTIKDTKKLWTQNKLRPGVTEDTVKIPIYEADIDADGSSVILNDHVYDFVITGEDVSETIHSGSEVELIFMVEQNGVTCEAFFPQYDVKIPLKTPDHYRRQIVSLDYLENQLNETYSQIWDLQEDFLADNLELEQIEQELDEISDELEKSGFDEDARDGILNRLRASARRIEKIHKVYEWEKLEARIEKRLASLEDANEDFGNPRSTRRLIDFQRQAERIINEKDTKLGKELLGNLDSFFFALTWREQTKYMVADWERNFSDINWEDRIEARRLLRQASDLHAENADFEKMRPVMISLLDLLPEDQKGKYDSSLLRG